MWLQFCRSRKVRSSKHSEVEYWYSKCTPITNAREFYFKDDKTDLQELIRYLDSKTSVNTTDYIVEREFDERVETVDSDAQERVDSVFEGPMEKVDDEETIMERADSRDRQTVDNGFHETVGRADFLEPMVDAEIQEPMEREFVDDMFEEELDVDDPMIMI